MGRKKIIIYISLLILITVISTITYFSYAFLIKEDEYHGKINMVTGTLDYRLDSSELTNNSITLEPNTTKKFDITIVSLNPIDSKYELYYEVNNNVEVGYSSSTIDLPTNTILANGTRVVKVRVTNTSNTNQTVTFGVVGGYINDTLVKTEGVAINQLRGLDTSSCTVAVGTVYNFDYNGKNGATPSPQTFEVPCDGFYKLETWGAQGGNADTTHIGGYGGYSIGNVALQANENIYVIVGGQGNTATGVQQMATGGYNGGGNAVTSFNNESCISTSGGGATHISKTSGLLKSLSGNIDQVLIVSGGGSGFYYDPAAPTWGTKSVAYGGGYQGTDATSYVGTTSSYVTAAGATQNTGYKFGEGQGCGLGVECAGSGGGFYGGVLNAFTGSGGSGYVGNSLLISKKMVCYNCSTSTDVNTYTESNTCVHTTATSNCSKKGNGYAKITYLGLTLDYDYTGTEQVFISPITGEYKLETWGGQAGSYSGVGTGGYGGYSTGVTNIINGNQLYVNVGGAGAPASDYNTVILGGYNGGGPALACGGKYSCTSKDKEVKNPTSSGGGATHIAYYSGLLSTLSSHATDGQILIVSGGGGGIGPGGYDGSNAGGYIGNRNTGDDSTTYGLGGSQTTAGKDRYNWHGAFGKASGGNTPLNELPSFTGTGGGGGYYGGARGFYNGASGSGGSGYIGSQFLTSKKMVCYNCATSTDASTFTESNTCTNQVATANCSKIGNGYARITYIGD